MLPAVRYSSPAPGADWSPSSNETLYQQYIQLFADLHVLSVEIRHLRQQVRRVRNFILLVLLLQLILDIYSYRCRV